MNLLAGKIYDPAAAVTKATTALLAMTALDTTNLRLTFTVPPSGMVRVRLSGTLHGATTFPQIMLGVLEGATVKGRQAPILGGGNLAATTLMSAWAEFIVSGLTPGASLTWDAAYGVETVVASTGLKYGGPNDTTANNNFGGFVFEIWDPCDVYTPASGVSPTTTVHQKLDTIDDFVDTEVAAIKSKTDNLPSDPADASDVAAAFTTVSGKLDVIDDFLDTEIAAIKAKTDNLPATPAATGDAMTLTVGERGAIADKLLNRNQQGGADSSPTVSQALASGLLKLEISGTTLTVKHGDDTTAFTRTVTREQADAILSLV